jgi:hypothetical protein
MLACPRVARRGVEHAKRGHGGTNAARRRVRCRHRSAALREVGGGNLQEGLPCPRPDGAAMEPDLNELIVGGGAGRIRDTFLKARETAISALIAERYPERQIMFLIDLRTKAYFAQVRTNSYGVPYEGRPAVCHRLPCPDPSSAGKTSSPGTFRNSSSNVSTCPAARSFATA